MNGASQKSLRSRKTGFKVAIFDDSTVTLQRYKTIFEGKGVTLGLYQLPVLSEAVIAALSRDVPDLIILDLLMGESREDGYGLLAQIRNEESLRSVPIVVCTKLINSSALGQNEKANVESVLGAGTAYPKVPDLPSAEEFLKHVKKSHD